jgi:hypothetical protein
MEVLLFAVSGALAGFMSGLLGIGGGLVLVSVLAAVSSMQEVEPTVLMSLTLGTLLATIMFTSLSSTRAHHQRGAVDWTIVQRMSPGVALGATCGALGASELPFSGECRSRPLGGRRGRLNFYPRLAHHSRSAGSVRYVGGFLTDAACDRDQNVLRPLRYAQLGSDGPESLCSKLASSKCSRT